MGLHDNLTTNALVNPGLSLAGYSLSAPQQENLNVFIVAVVLTKRKPSGVHEELRVPERR